MKNSYLKVKNENQKMFNSFPLFFAFNQKQFKEGTATLKTKCPNDVLSVGHGCYILKKDEKNFDDLINEMNLKMDDLLSTYQGAYDAFIYELGNHEYCITFDLTDTMDALGLSFKDVKSKDFLLKALEAATRDYLESAEY